MAPGAGFAAAALMQESPADVQTTSTMTFSAADGESDSQVQLLVQAMAAFSPVPAGMAVMGPLLMQGETMMAANWQ
jgi:hypothetical protein